MFLTRLSNAVVLDAPTRRASVRRRLSLFSVAVTLLFCSVAGSAAVDPALFQDLRWRLIGPFRGGRVLAVSGVPGEPEHFYFGGVNGGVWETRDAGRTWIPIFDGQPVGSIGALAVAPSNRNVIYVGTGEADMRSDIAQGDGMYRSPDGGRSWSHIGLADSQQIAKILVHPDNPDLIYVAALGHPYGPSAERGLFRSRDGGQSWQKILGRNNDADTGAIDVVFEPGNPDVLYAALWQTRRTPWSVYPPSNGPGSGLFKSTDRGDHWTELQGHGLPEKPGRIGLAVAPTAPQRVYAIIDAERGGMYRSDDGGGNWTRTSEDSRIWGRGWYFAGITVEPGNADVIYSCNTNLYRSDDAGKTFAPVKGAPGGDDYHTLWIDPLKPERRILGVDQGAVISINNGRSWSSWFNQPTGQFYHCITDNRFPYWVYGSQQDSGAAGVPSRTNTIDGINITDFREITAGGESDNLAPDPNDPDILYGGRVERLDMKTHQTRSIDPTLAYPENDRRTWTLPLVFSVRDPHVLYFANQKVFRTEDGGSHWSVISPDLTREDPGSPTNLDPATAALEPEPGHRHGVVYAIAPSRLADHDLWVGTDDGFIWRSRDEGQHWQNVTPTALTGWSKVGIIEASHFDAETAYAAVDRHRLEDVKPYIYRTHDGGTTWQLITTGIPNGHFVNAVREDPVRKGLLYAATEKGVFVSFDDGDRWQSLQMNLPVTSVRDIDVHGDDIVLATHGRAFWVLDQVGPLRQLADSANAGEARLFRPATTVRERPAGFTGSPMPKDEPMASNPPAGAYIDYILAAHPTEPVTLDILDEHDGLVRRYSTTQTVPLADPARLRVAPEWFVTPSTLSTSPGMHRFIWPLRYASPAALAAPGRGPWADGVWAPPGSYKVVLTVDGKRFTEPLVVVADPRIELSSEAYAQQFALARDITETWASVAAALDEAEKIVKNTLARRDAADPGTRRTLEALQNRAVEISDAIAATNPSNFWWRAPAHTTSLRFLNTALEKLATAVDGADGAPSPDARDGYSRVRGPAEAAVKAWNDFKAGDVAAFNQRLAAGHQPPIL
jgi:photosystem II stability/assembly factor-like uncharacterized protein